MVAQTDGRKDGAGAGAAGGGPGEAGGASLLQRLSRAWNNASAAAARRGRLVIGASFSGILATLVWIAMVAPRHADVHEIALLMEREALQAFLARDPSASMLPEGGVLVSVRQQLVGDLLASTLPYTHDFGRRLRVSLDSASVAFDRGLARIQLHGQASLPNNPDLFALMTVSGVLAVEGLTADGNALRTRVEVLGFQFDDLEHAGIAAPILRATNRLTAEIVHEAGRVLGEIELPIRLTQALDLPPVEDDDVTIPGVRVPVELTAREIHVLAGRIWISLGARVGESAPEPHATEVAGRAP